MGLKSTVAAVGLCFSAFTLPVFSADYVIDTKGAHASIEFKVSHLGYSWLKGRFNNFSGTFSYDEASPEQAVVAVSIDVTSLDSNHAERDKHLRGDDFLDVKKYPEASFKSTGFQISDSGEGTLSGMFTLKGVTKPLDITVTKIGEGEDPWGGYRAGFSGVTAFKLKDFGIDYNLGPASETVYLELEIEGVRE